jgi:pyridoxine 4-dehydrogenase
MSRSMRLGELAVQRVGFGAMRIVDPVPLEQSRAVLRRVVELGLDFVDTADIYGAGQSEERIADALHPYPDGLVIGTKGGLVHRDGGIGRDGSPEHLRAAVEASLRRLRLERIDLYQLHRVDPQVPVEESVGALAELQQEGKIRHLGLSNVDLEELARARSVAAIVSVQNEYNRDDRRSEDVLEVCERDGLAFLPWYPLGGPDRRIPPEQGLPWLLERSAAILPIPGTSSVAHLEQNVAAAGL